MADGDAELIASRVLHGSGEQRVKALDAYREQFAVVIDAATEAVLVADPLRVFVVDRVMQFGHLIRGKFLPVFTSATDPEVKFYVALLLVFYGARDEVLSWLLEVASTPGQYRYEAAYHLGNMRFPQVEGAILGQLRGASLESPAECDQISGLLHVWGLTGKPLPADLLARFRAPDVPPGVQVAMKSFV